MTSPTAFLQFALDDRHSETWRLHSRRLAEHLRPLITPDLVAEHRRSPLHRVKSPALLHVLDALRQEPIEGKLAVLARIPGSSYQIIRLAGALSRPNDLSDRRRFATEADALHAIFLQRLEEMGLGSDWLPEDGEPESTTAPENEPYDVESHLIGYTSELGAKPGRPVDVYLSSSVPLTAKVELVSLGYGVATGEVREDVVIDLGDHHVDHQAVTAGSTAVVRDISSLTAQQPVFALSLLATAPDKGRQVLLSHVGTAITSTLEIDTDGFLAAGVTRHGETTRVTLSQPVYAGSWYSVAFGVVNGELVLSAHPAGTSAANRSVPPASVAPMTARRTATAGPLGGGELRFAAESGAAGWTACFDGKIETPVLLDGADPVGVAAARAQGTPAASLDAAIAIWDPSLALGPAGVLEQKIPGRTRTADGSFVPVPELGAECRNSPAWAVTSSNWNGDEQVFTRDPRQWAALHFHRDDLDDCRWTATLRCVVPDDLPSGAYAFRATAPGMHPERLPLFVEPGSAHRRIAVIIPTASYLAYANDHLGTIGQMAQAIASRTPVLMQGDMFMQQHPEYGLSCYDCHSDGSGVGYSSIRRPLLNMRPTHRYHVGAWQLPADLHLISWLNDENIEYDVITDHTLHAEGRRILDNYAVVMTTTHSEYYSKAMLDAVEGWIGDGGRFLYLGANGFYWKVDFDPSRPWVMEVRRGENGSRAWDSAPGELYQAFSGERGGLWKYQGRAPQKVFGVGFASQGFDSAGWYRKLDDAKDPRAAFIFDGVGQDTFGHHGNEGGGAAGQETDRYDLALGTPRDTLLLATSEGLSDGYLRAVEEVTFLVSGTGASTDPYVRADMTYFVNDNGGAVFATGSIAWSGALGVDDGVSAITRNVIRRFADAEPLPW